MSCENELTIHCLLIRQHSFIRMSFDDHQCTCSIQNKIDKLISSLHNWTGQLNVYEIKNFHSVQNVDLMKNTNSSYCLIPPNLYFPKDRYTNNGCSIFCNGKKYISSNSNQKIIDCFDSHMVVGIVVMS